VVLLFAYFALCYDEAGDIALFRDVAGFHFTFHDFTLQVILTSIGKDPDFTDLLQLMGPALTVNDKYIVDVYLLFDIRCTALEKTHDRTFLHDPLCSLLFTFYFRGGPGNGIRKQGCTGA